MKSISSAVLRLSLAPLAALLLLSQSVAAAAGAAPLTTTVSISIPSTHQFPNPHAVLKPSTRATLTALHASHSAPISVSSGFVFGNVSAGSYLLDVHCTTHAFAPLRVDVLIPDAAEGQQQQQKLVAAAWETFRGNDWDNKGEAAQRDAAGAFEVKIMGGKNYYMERQSFSVLSILKNPMILMALVAMGLFVGMPYLVDNMDEETRAEWEEHQKSSPMNTLLGGGGGGSKTGGAGGFDMAAFLAGSNTKQEDSGSGKANAGSGPSTPASSGGRKGGKR